MRPCHDAGGHIAVLYEKEVKAPSKFVHRAGKGTSPITCWLKSSSSFNGRRDNSPIVFAVKQEICIRFSISCLYTCIVLDELVYTEH